MQFPILRFSCLAVNIRESDDTIVICNSLKILNPKIWGDKVTIDKRRVDCRKESARVLFVKMPNNDIELLHGFVKKTRKTPNKDVKIAMVNLERLKKT